MCAKNIDVRILEKEKFVKSAVYIYQNHTHTFYNERAKKNSYSYMRCRNILQRAALARVLYIPTCALSRVVRGWQPLASLSPSQPLLDRYVRVSRRTFELTRIHTHIYSEVEQPLRGYVIAALRCCCCWRRARRHIYLIALKCKHAFPLVVRFFFFFLTLSLSLSPEG